jgi:tetratricopeptide (TPR) repeat protein
MANKPEEAALFLESSITEDPAFVKAHLYLGIVYQQLKRPDDAITVFRKILPRAGNDTALIAYNLGNVYYSKGSTELARQYYTQAIETDSGFSSAYLNRANTLIRNGALDGAIPDYEYFLRLEPGSPKRSQIEKLITFIRAEFAAEEARKILAEERVRQEEERRRQLLEDVAASLLATSAEGQGLSAGSEGVLGYDDAFVLE